jgi:arylformamidase
MRTVDITRTMEPGMFVHPGDPPFEMQPVATLERDGCAVCSLRLGTHTGTHLDAPAHFILGGATVDQAPLDLLCGPARVVDARSVGGALDAAFFAAQWLDGVVRLLLRTVDELPSSGGTSGGPNGLTREAAEWLRRSTAVRLLGIDRPSIEAADAAGFPVHHLLLGGVPPTWILEDLDLGAAEPGDHELLCLPLRLAGADGAPVRAVLRPAE